MNRDFDRPRANSEQNPVKNTTRISYRPRAHFLSKNSHKLTEGETHPFCGVSPSAKSWSSSPSASPRHAELYCTTRVSAYSTHPPVPPPGTPHSILPRTPRSDRWRLSKPKIDSTFGTAARWFTSRKNVPERPRINLHDRSHGVIMPRSTHGAQAPNRSVARR